MNNDGTSYATTYPSRLINTSALKAEIAEKLVISEVCEEVLGIGLIASGHQSKGCCPLHAEDTPSFYVNDAKGMYHCFGCKAGGYTIDLLQRAKNLGFREALAELAEAAEIDISHYERDLTPEEKETEAQRRSAEEWLEGLYSRGTIPDRITKEQAEVFGVTTGSTKPQKLKGFPDYLFDGVIFPYRAPSGRLVGWKTRKPDKVMFGIPKDSLIYEPTLFGIEVAREHMANGEVYIVEGEYDAIAVHGSGTENVVAMGGSNFTEDQMALLKQLKVRKAIFVFDGDEGGKTGAAKVAKDWWDDREIQVAFKTLPEGADPEDIVKMGLDLTMYPAVSAIEWLLNTEWAKRQEDGLTGKIDFLEHVRTEYGSKLDADIEDLVLIRVAELVGLPEAAALDLTRSEKTDLQSSESERAVLGEALRSQNYFMEVRKTIHAEDFFILRHRRLWRMLEDMLTDGLVFDVETIKAQVVAVGVDPEYVDELLACGAGNLTWHEDNLIDLSVRREAQRRAEKFTEQIADTNTDSTTLIGDLTTRMTTKAIGRGSEFPAITDQVDEAMELLHERMANPSPVHGIGFGEQFPRLAINTQGLQPRRLVLLAAASGEGKSTISLQIACGLAVQQSVPTDFVSLEMDESEMLYKLASHMTGVKASNITSGQLEPEEAKIVEQAMMRIRKSPLRLYCPDGITPNEFVLYCRQAKMDRRTEVFMIDYAQMISPDPGMEQISDYKLYGDFGRDAKQKVARAMDVTVWACAQLNRASKEKDRPTKEQMGDSYDLVRHADVIMILSSNEDTQICDFWLDKNRQGPGGILIPMNFERDTQTFHESNGGSKIPTYRVM